MQIKNIIKAATPRPILRYVRAIRTARRRQEYAGLTTREVFSKIYREGVWGGAGQSEEAAFNSGSGSREEAVVSTYVEHVGSYLAGLGRKPDVVDLGCGDFLVGARLRALCGAYTACDIVPELLAHNQARFAGLGVTFKELDIIEQELPPGEVVFLRQVLQHLSNAQIARIVPKLGNYRTLVLTEHLPEVRGFAPNLDKPTGPDVRHFEGSGVVLTAPPFNLPVESELVLCEVPSLRGVIRTTVYTLPARQS